ncbi:MAG: ABC transporter permease subunit, partial [Pseudomonadota bacterium]
SSVEGGLQDLFSVYGAKTWQRFLWLKLPAVVPFLLSGLKIAAGLALIGAVVAEFVAGSGTATGLAWRLLESANRLEIAKMFACLILLALLGILQYYSLAAIERWWRKSRLA